MKTLLVIVIFMMGCVIFYLFLIMPRIFGRPDIKPFNVKLYAHRGLHDNSSSSPENSASAILKAVEAGYGIELDVRLTKDKVPVVFHDLKLERVCGVKGDVNDYTYEELLQFKLFDSMEKIPRFEDVLELVNGRVPLIIEYKTENTDISVCSAADKILQKYKGDYCIESFNPLAVAWYRKNRTEIVRGQLSEKFFTEGKKNILNFILENLLLNFYARPDFIAYNHKHYHNLSRIFATKIYSSIPVAYTVRSREEYEAAKKHFEWYIFENFNPEENTDIVK